MEKPLMMTIHKTCNLWRDYMKTLSAKAGVPPSYRLILTYLLGHPGASVKEVAEFRDTTLSAISQLILKMEKDGYITKKPDEKDQRSQRLYLTDLGISTAENIRSMIHEADAKITEILTPEKEAEIIAWMKELGRIIEKDLHEC